MAKNKISKVILDIKKKSVVREVMTRKLITLHATDTIKDAVELMSRHSISTIVVIEGNKLSGVLTERDMVKKVLLHSRPMSTRISEIMSKTPVTIGPDEPILAASRLMKSKKVRKLIVLEHGMPVGILSETDIVRSLNEINENYKYLLWNPWISVIVFLLVTIMFIVNYLLFRK